MSSFIRSMLTDNETTTENGMKTYTTSEDNCTDFFFACGALRNQPEERILELFWSAFSSDPTIALQILFYSRDIRGGQGERKLFRTVLASLASKVAERENSQRVLSFLEANIHLIPHYGRWDDVLSMLGFDPMLDAFIAGFIKTNLKYGDALCAKWMPREKSSKKDIAKKLASLMGLSAKEYRKLLSSNTKVVENKMCAKEWADIEFGKVPSQAFLRYKKAFERHQAERFIQFNKDVAHGKEKVNAGTLHPHQVVESILEGRNVGRTYNYDTGEYEYSDDDMPVKNLVNCNLWSNLKEFYTTDEQILPIVDVSGSMCQGKPQAIHVSIALGIYLSERNNGPFKDFFITFDDNPAFVSLSDCESIIEKVYKTADAPWGGTTNLEKTFRTILCKAVKQDIPADDMPKKIIIFSDMEFNEAVNERWGAEFNYSALEMIEREYSNYGYEMPKIIFWNLASRQSNNPVRFDQEGTALVSGFSPSIMTSLLGGDDITPYSIMMKTLEKYSSIEF